MGAISYQKTPTSTDAWDGGTAVKNLKAGQDKSYYEKEFTWEDSSADLTTKVAYKLPHHEVDGDGNIGAANVKSCQSIIGILNGAQGGADIPDGDKQAVYNHVSKHLKDAGVEPTDLKKSAPKPSKQRCFATMDIKVRSGTADDGQTNQFIDGYAAKFNSWSENLGFFVPVREKLDPHAFDECDMSDVKCLFNHDPNQPLGRNTIKSGSGSLNVGVDGMGVNYNCQPTPTSYAADLLTNMNAGIINQCSFAFDEPDDDDAESVEWNGDEQTYERTINKISRLYDVSPVTYPAYPNAECAIGERSLKKIREMDFKRNNPEPPTAPPVQEVSTLDLYKRQLELKLREI